SRPEMGTVITVPISLAQAACPAVSSARRMHIRSTWCRSLRWARTVPDLIVPPPRAGCGNSGVRKRIRTARAAYARLGSHAGLNEQERDRLIDDYQEPAEALQAARSAKKGRAMLFGFILLSVATAATAQL